jgi:hypothetical protein
MVITTGFTGLAFAASFAFAIDAVARTRFGNRQSKCRRARRQVAARQ